MLKKLGNQIYSNLDEYVDDESKGSVKRVWRYKDTGEVIDAPKLIRIKYQQYPAYTEYTDERGNHWFYNIRNRSIRQGIIVRHIPVGSKVVTPQLQNAQEKWRAKQLSQKEIAQNNKDLGSFFFVGSDSNTFDGVDPATAARSAYLASYLRFGTDELWETQRKQLKRIDLDHVMHLQRSSTKDFWEKVNGKLFYSDEDGFLHTKGGTFIYGPLNKNSILEYQKLYAVTLQDLYHRIPVSQHKKLGFIIKVLPYINIEYNTLCQNPAETDKSRILPLTAGDFCTLVGYDPSRVKKLIREYSRLTFTVADGEEEFCRFVLTDVDNLLKSTIFVNPRLIYRGSDYRKIEALEIYFNPIKEREHKELKSK